MSSNDDLKRVTADEWRELGFFYDRRDDSMVWLIIGSRSGVLRFRDLLIAYANDPANDLASEHAHYGPYMYLKVTTWPSAELVSDGIRGPLPALRALADRITKVVDRAAVGEMIDLGS